MEGTVDSTSNWSETEGDEEIVRYSLSILLSSVRPCLRFQPVSTHRT